MLPSDSLEQVEDHSEPEPDCQQGWCCGCSEHPVGKPWGWNADAWNDHMESTHPDFGFHKLWKGYLGI